ncbi:hypothetical protein V7O66_13995 [Methanolobus sp. ZRKC3]|uniref:hypothetical protein n=1 Tax=Methanolobus sp. ZRKC3 TaxID=3125786 RepID=UPI003254377A
MVYIKTTCPTCGDHSFHHVRLHRLTTFHKNKVKSEITSAEVTDSCTPEELATSVLHELAGHVYNGMATLELCKILKDKFGILEQYCCDIVQRLKVELDMYSPDHQHLYFV